MVVYEAILTDPGLQLVEAELAAGEGDLRVISRSSQGVVVEVRTTDPAVITRLTRALKRLEVDRLRLERSYRLPARRP